MKAGKILVIALGVVIIVLLGVLLFYNPAKGPAAPAVPPENASATIPAAQ
jgi:hypothetical protein